MSRPIALAAIGAAIGAMGQEVRGVPKAEWPTYHTGGAVFNCRDGTHSIPFARLNDDYCDCADGSDEPGTSACLSSRFFCANRGFRSQYVRSSHVGDGVCDCCDGNDEYASGACPDVCQQAGAAARVEAAEILHKVTAGLDKATRWAAEGSSAKTGWETELAGLKASLLEKQSAADALAEVKKVAEARESELRDAFLKKREEEEAARKAADEAAAAANGSDEPAPSEVAAAASEAPEGGEQAGGAASEPDAGGAAGDSDADLDAKYPPTDVHPSEEGEHEYAGEEGGDEGYGDEDDNRHWDDIDHEPTEDPADEPADEPAVDEPAVDADVPTDPGEGSDEGSTEDDGWLTAAASRMDHARLSFIQGVRYALGFSWLRKWLGVKSSSSSSKASDRPYADFSDPEAEALRDKHRAATTEVSEIETKISEVEKRMGVDYGPGMLYEPLSRECFTFNSGGEWDYEFCPFKDAKQKGKGGGSTGLGSWQGFEDDYTVMKFTNGQHCWNGPSRSLTVTLTCAAEHKIVAVDEPEVCKYDMRFETPAACTPAHATRAQADLDALSPALHDEL